MEKVYEEIKQIKDMVSQLITIVGNTNARFEEMQGNTNARFDEMQDNINARFEEMQDNINARFDEMQGNTNARFEEMQEQLKEIKEELGTKASTDDLVNLTNVIDEKFDEVMEVIREQNEYFHEQFGKHEQEIFRLNKKLKTTATA